MKTNITNKGYEAITFMCHGKSTFKSIHRLVAEAFIPNPEGKPQINHIDGNKLNNCVENLEWCTGSENVTQAYNTGLKNSKKGINNVLSKAIEQYDLNGKLIFVYGSIREAERVTKIKNQSIIQALKGRYKTAGGFVWKYLIN